MGFYLSTLAIFFVSFVTIKPSFDSVNAQSSKTECYTVPAGEHYSKPRHSLEIVKDKVFSTWVFINESMSRYIWPPDDLEGSHCSQEWNKLFGKSRCGEPHHHDSDRFLWARPRSCFIFNDTRIIGVNKSCSRLNYVQIATASYVNGVDPYSFREYGHHFKLFKTMLRINEWHYLQLTVEDEYTDFYLRTFDGKEETLRIMTRKCLLGPLEYGLFYYFGGFCTAPQSVTGCYSTLVNRTMTVL